MKDKFLEFFQEDHGGMSMTRLVTFLLVVVPILSWAAISLYHMALTEIPASVVTVTGMGLATKVVQKTQEQKNPDLTNSGNV